MAIIDKKEKIKSSHISSFSKIKLKSTDEVSAFAENIINTVREPLLLLDKELRVVTASRSFYDFFKVNPDEIIGKLIFDLGNHQWNIPELRELLETILSENRTFDNYKVEIDFSTIGNRIMLLNARKIERGSGNEQLILLSIEDITDRKLTDESLSETHRVTKEYLDNLFNHGNAPIIIWDTQFKIIRFNKAFESLTGRTEKNVIGVPLDVLFPPSQRDGVMEVIKTTIEGERLEVAEISILHIDGSVRTILWNSANIMSPDGKTSIATIAQGQDITERKQVEKKLQEKKEQIAAQNEKFIQINKELSFQNEEKEKRATELIIANKELVFQNEEKEKRADELIIADKELGFQNEEKEKRADELIIANKELGFQNEEKEKRADELIIANKELGFQNEEKEKRADELIIADKELGFQNEEKEKRAAELIIANKELAFQNREKEKRADELIIANKELAFQNGEKEKRADELIIANKKLAVQNEEKEKRAAELIIANKKLAFQNEEKEKRAAELIIANNELAFQNREKEKRADELIIANKELAFQNEEKEKRADELIIANKKLAFQNEEKEKRAAELSIANKKLAFQNEEKEKRAAELIIANKKLAFQNREKEKRADELIMANKELAFQNEEKEKRAEELIIANKELAFQNEEKEKRAEELIIANKELAFQNEEKEKRAEELIIANRELAFQNREKEKRADELIIANKELQFQNEEKEKRAAELIIADKELAFQNEEKEKRADELIIADKELVFQNEEKEKQENANKELEAFSYSVSHDLRAPLRHIGGFVDLLKKNNSAQLDETGLRYLNTISESSLEMGNLIDALLTFSRLSRAELQRTNINSKNMVTRVTKTLSDEFEGRNVEINISDLPDTMGDANLINQVWVNLLSNALKYSRNKEKAVIEIGGKAENDQTIFYIKDNGAGFDMKYADKLFGVFQRLHKARDFEGIGIGLANVNRIVTRHGGKCWAESEVGKGATFFFSILNN